MKKLKKTAVPKNSALYGILKGVSLEDVNKARGGKSTIRIDIESEATSIKQVKIGD